MAYVITEDDLFKYLVQHEDVSMDVSKNIYGFLSDIPINIFKNEYYILYKAFEFGHRFKMVINLIHLEQMVLSNMEELLKDKNVTMHQGGEETYTDNERANLIQQNVSATYQMLSEYDIEGDDPFLSMRFNINLYIKEWATEEYSKTLIAQNNILREGVTYNRKMYKGVEDAQAYNQKKYEIIRSLLNGSVDRLSDVIDTTIDTPEEIREKQEEEAIEIVSRVGVDEWDEHYPLGRKEMIVIQGGSGVGKTRQGVNICYNAAVDYKKNVLVLSLEQVSARIFPMFTARHSTRYTNSEADWISDKDIIRKNLDSHQQMTKNLIEDDLITNEDYGGIRVEGINLHANDVRSYLEKVWDDGFHFDVVMLDYLGILNTGGENRYQALTNVVNDLKAECKTFMGKGFLAVLPNQITQEAEKALIEGNYDLSSLGGSETQYLKRGADYVYTSHQTDEMKLTNKMMWLIEKVRLGSPITSRIDLLAYQGQCLYLSDDLDEEEDDELI